MKSKAFAKNTSLVLVRLVLGAGSALFTSSFLARCLGPDGNGIYALVILFPMLATAIGGLGVGSASVYFISKGKHKIPEVVAKNIVISLAAATFVVLIALAIFLAFGQKLWPNVPQQLIVVSLLFTFPVMMFGNLGAIFQGQQNFKLHGFFTLLPQILTLILIVFGFRFFNKDKLTIAILAWGLSYVLSLLAIAYHFKTELYFFPRSIKQRTHYLANTLKYGLKAHIGNLITFLNYRVDVFLLGTLAGTHAVGIYAVTVPITEGIWLVSNAASAVLFPLIASLRLEDKSKNITPLISRWVLLVTILAALLVISVKSYIVSLLFGAKFIQSAQVLLWLLPGAVLWSTARVLCNDIAGRGKPEINLFISLGALAINIIANLILIPKFGVYGAALASSVSYSCLTITVLIVYSRLLKVKLSELLLPSYTDMLLVKRLLGRPVSK